MAYLKTRDFLHIIIFFAVTFGAYLLLMSAIGSYDENVVVEKEGVVMTDETNEEQNVEETVEEEPAKENEVAVTPAPRKCSALFATPVGGRFVDFPLKIDVEIDRTDGCQWTTFEGGAGTMELFYKQGEDWVKIGETKPLPAEDWMSPTIDLSVTYDFDNSDLQLKKGTPMRILFTSENPSGISENSREFELLFHLNDSSAGSLYDFYSVHDLAIGSMVKGMKVQKLSVSTDDHWYDGTEDDYTITFSGEVPLTGTIGGAGLGCDLFFNATTESSLESLPVFEQAPYPVWGVCITNASDLRAAAGEGDTEVSITIDDLRLFRGHKDGSHTATFVRLVQ